MDRPLNPTYRHRQHLRRIGYGLLMGVALAGVVVWLPGWIRPSFERRQMRTAQVEWGPVEAGITAAGKVVPEFEQVISSPISSRVVAILERPGAQVEKGQPLLALDLSASRLRVERLAEEVALKANRRAQLEQERERLLAELETRKRIKELELANLRERTWQHQELLKIGAVSQQYVREAELSEARATLELEKVKRNIKNVRRATQTELEGLALERRILEMERLEAQRKLERAEIRADRAGVLTWVLPEEGVSVAQGAVVARVADLSSFRVEATVASMHAEKVHAGLSVQVLLDQEKVLSGRVARVLPALRNGVLHLEVQLDEPSSPLLRAEMRVEVRLVTLRRKRALRLEKGLFSQRGDGAFEVFVVRGDRALRRSVRLGIAGYEYYEVEEGLAEGDEVVLTDTRDYEHIAEVRIR